jgi:hypothetical protein
MRLFQEKGALKTDIQSVSGKGGADLLQIFKELDEGQGETGEGI